MESIFALLKYTLLGFFGLLAALFVLALLFGKRVRKRWEFEADFLDEGGREYGEVEVELSRIEKEESVDTFKAELQLRHASLRKAATVKVFIDDTLILQGQVENEGRILLGNDSIQNRLTEASAGQIARVLVGDVEVASAPLRPD